MPQIYVHTDRDIYFPGGRVWYKAYVLRDGKLDYSVRNLYIDWADEKGNIMRSDVALIANGISPNSFYIPIDYSSSHLQFNAYLGRMEQHREYGYYRTLTVVQKGHRSPTLTREHVQPKESSAYELRLVDVDSTKLAAQILTEHGEASVVMRGRINYYDLFEQPLTLQKDKPNQIILPTQDLEAGLLQVKVFGQDGKELASAATLVGAKGVIVRPTVQVDGKNLVVQLPAGEEADMSLSVSLSDLPFDTVHTIVNDMLYANLVQDEFPKTWHISSAELSKRRWRWADFPKDLTDTAEEDLLKLRGKIVMDAKSSKKFLREKAALVKNRKVIRGVSFGSQTANEPMMSYKLIPWAGDFDMKLPDMVFFGPMEIQTKLADPELQNIPFDTKYSFQGIGEQKTFYRPYWEDYRISHDLTTKWLPIYDNYPDELLNQIDTVDILRSGGKQLVEKYDPGQDLGSGRSEIIRVQSDEHVKKYSTSFEQYFPMMRTTQGGFARHINQVAFFLNRTQVRYEDIKDMDMINFAYVRVFFDASSVPGFRIGGQYRSVVQLVELPPSERRGTFSVNTTVEGYVEPKSFTDPGKLTYWWQPLLTVSEDTSVSRLTLPVELAGKRITIQGVTKSGKLVYFNEIL